MSKVTNPPETPQTSPQQPPAQQPPAAVEVEDPPTPEPQRRPLPANRLGGVNLDLVERYEFGIIRE